MYNAGVACPQPILLRSHVLLMDFLGTGGWPAPRLADVAVTESKAREMYWDLALMVRKIYQVCRLVHSEFRFRQGYSKFLDDLRGMVAPVPKRFRRDPWG
jgi:serine/threonine-protein kinase RIO1